MITEIVSALDALPGRKFAVIDAAHFDDLQAVLAGAGFAFRPLYLDEKEEDVAAAGPHLVPLPDRNAARRLYPLLEGKPAAVWWSWPDSGDETETAIYKHLRTVNMAEIPVEHSDGDSPGAARGPAPAPDRARGQDTHSHHGHGHEGHGHHHHEPPNPQERYELAVFRHADPNVMAMLLPLLDAGQVSRLFGDAMGIVVESVDLGGVRTFARPEGLPEKPPGWFRLRYRQYEVVVDSLAQASTESIATYLRQVARPQTVRISNHELGQKVAGWVGEARGMGVEGPGAQRRWCYMQLVSSGALTDNPDVEEALRSPWGTPDQKVWLMMQNLIAAVHKANRS